MKRFICAVLTLTLLLGLMLPCAHAAGEEEFHGYLVGLPELRLMSVQDVDADITPLTDDVCLVDSLADVRAMQKAGLVEYYEPNYPMYLMASRWNMAFVGAPSVWNHQAQSTQQEEEPRYDRRGTGVTIAVIDSGVYADHTDFNSERILPYHDYYNNENGVDIYHGTFVAGLIAAQVDNNIGIDGAAPDVNILPITITKGGKSDTAVAIQALDYAVQQGADVINLSIGGTKSTLSLQRACQAAVDAGVIIVAAAGNYAEDATDLSEKNIIYPAGYDCVVSVSGCKRPIDKDNKDYDFIDNPDFDLEFDHSYSYFNNKVNVCAPGTKVWSLFYVKETAASATASGSGTSFAAPIVSSMAAIAKQVNPAITQDTFTALVQDTATDLGEPGYDVYYGHGLVNMEAFCQALEEEYPIRYLSGSEEAEFEEDVPRTYTLADPDITLPTPVREGYRFTGWYSNPGLMGRAVTSIPTASMGEKTFYAAWQKNPNTAPAITAGAPHQANAAPASRDGITAAEAFTADVSEWFSDAEGDAITVELVEGPAELTENLLTYIPATQDAGKNVLLRFRASDSKGAVSNIHTVTVRVGAVPNSAPAIAAGAPAAAEASPLSADGKTAAVPFRADVSEWFTDADREALNYYLIEGPATLDNSLLVFTPVPQEAGQEITLRVQAEDSSGARSPIHTVTVHVSQLPNSAPVVTASGPAEVYCTPASLDGKTPAQSFSAELAEWFFDPDGDALTYQILEGPGTLSAADYTYTPAANEAGRDYPLRLQATDQKGAVSPVLSITIHVSAVPNSAPISLGLAPEEFRVVPASLDGKTPATDIEADVSEWFSDPDGDALIYSVLEGPGIIVGSGYFYTPAPDEAGREYTLRIQADDPSGAGSPIISIRITVAGASNSAPFLTGNAPQEAAAAPASRDSLTGAKPFTADVRGWFGDADGDTLSYRLISGPAALDGAMLSYTPAEQDAQKDISIQLQARDTAGLTSPVLTITIHVDAVPNSAPYDCAPDLSRLYAVPASRDGAVPPQPCTADVADWFLDPDGDTLTYRITEGPGILAGSLLTFTPDTDSEESVLIRLTATDPSGSASAALSVPIRIGAVPNSAPAISSDAPTEVGSAPPSHDGAIPTQPVSLDLRALFTDPDGDALTFTKTDGPGALEGSTYTFIPTTADSGKDYTLQLQASDDSGAYSPVLTITVHVAANPNSAPTVSADIPSELSAAPASLDGDTPACPVTVDLGEWFLDPDGNAMTYQLLAGPGTIEGSLYSYTPSADDSGKTLEVQVQARDSGDGLSEPVTFRLVVAPLPQSQSTLADAEDVRLDLCLLPAEVLYTLRLYDNAVTGVSLNGEEIAWRMEDEILHVEIPAGLSEGDAELCISFDKCEPVTTRWTIFRDCPSAPFKDIVLGAWYHSSVDFAVRRGLMNGTSADRFAPGNPFTRAMLVTVLYRMEGQPETAAECPFDDVPAGQWYTDPVAWAAEKGIVNGTAPGKFAPNSPVTREQLVTILFRYAGDDGVRAGLDAFPDAGAVSSYARDAMDWAIGHGIISGIESAGTVTLSPRSSATRAQVAAILMRFINSRA